jgi:uncharacterized membrane protein YkoI
VDRKGLITGVAVVVLALGGGGAALAVQQAQEEEQDIKGTVVAPVGSGEENETTENETPESEAAEEVVEIEEAGGLTELTRIDRAAAEEAARGAVSGGVREVELESENGFVVYEVEIAGEDGRLREVIVDAGNGKVLGQEIE